VRLLPATRPLAVRAGWILCPMPERRVTCGDCGASRTFPDGDWEKVQRAAIDAWAEAHQQDAHDGKAVSGWDLDPNPVFGWLAAVTERAPGLFAHWKYCATA
jgi:hypothetical protein